MDSDQELMIGYQNGSEEAFIQIYKRYSGRIYGYLRKKLGGTPIADDLFQMVFQKLHKNRLKYDSGFPLSAWIFTICHNILADHFRVASRNREVPGVFESIANETQSPPTESRALDGLCLDQFPKLQKDALSLRYTEELPFDEIARRLNVTSDYARQLVSRAVRRIRKLYSPKERGKHKI